MMRSDRAYVTQLYEGMKVNVLRCLTIFVSFLWMVAGCGQMVFAAGHPTLYSESSEAEKISEGKYLVPLYISGNTGIMGFRIRLESESENVKIHSVSKGVVTKEGSFASDVNASGSESVNVLWNTIENVKTNGSLMYIGVSVLDKEESSIQITVSYDQMDTFDEEYKDVVLTCKDINIPIDGASEKQEDVTTEEQGEDGSTEDKTESDMEDSSTEEVTEDADNSSTEESSDSESDDEDDMDDDNSEKYTGEEANATSAPGEGAKDDLETFAINDENSAKKAAQKDAKKSEIVSRVGEENIRHAICLALAYYGVTAIDRVPAEKEAEFYSIIKKYLKENCNVKGRLVEQLDISAIVNDVVLTEEDIELIRTYISDGIPEASQISKSNPVPIWFIIIGIILIGTIAFLIWRWYRAYCENGQ